MGWIGRTLEARRLSWLLAEVAVIKGKPLTAALEIAVVKTARALPLTALERRLRPLYPRLVLVFARQLEDANMRLSSSHWFSGGGRNVGMDVLEARARALELLLKASADRPRLRRPLSDTVDALDTLIVARRKGAGDPDGYGLATLHQIRRDLAELALSEGAVGR